MSLLGWYLAEPIHSGSEGWQLRATCLARLARCLAKWMEFMFFAVQPRVDDWLLSTCRVLPHIWVSCFLWGAIPCRHRALPVPKEGREH